MSQITTHVLDTASGKPAAGLPIQLYRQQSEGWVELFGGATDADGRIGDLLPVDEVLAGGIYRMYFDTKAYYGDKPCFYPYVDVVFEIGGGGEHYHIPLLLAPYGYSTYRGS